MRRGGWNGGMIKKIPTIFERDWNGDRSRVLNQINPAAQWVFDGEGNATRKIHGSGGEGWTDRSTGCRDLAPGQAEPDDFDLSDHDKETGKKVGWMPTNREKPERIVGTMQAWDAAAGCGLEDGVYELVGPKVQGDPEAVGAHRLVRHGEGIAGPLDAVPRTFDALREWLTGKNIEGVVWHHPDGRMAKIKLRDFGLKRTMNAKTPAG